MHCTGQALESIGLWSIFIHYRHQFLTKLTVYVIYCVMHEEYIQKLFNECNVGRLLGIEIYEIEEGRAKGKLTIKREHINAFGNAHGGILFTLADHVGGACGNSLGKMAVLVESSIQYMKGAKEGETVFAEATLIHKGNKIGRIDIKVHREDGDLIALINAVFYMKGDDHKTKTPKNL